MSLKLNFEIATLAAAGALILGFVYGVMEAGPQIALESAQVLAGIVEYPDLHPRGMYYKKVWNLINQLSALALYFGTPERMLSAMLGGIGGGIFFSGITLVTYAMSRNLFLSLIMPLVVIWTRVAGADTGVTYPILFPGAWQTHGIFGLSLVVLALGLLGCGYRKTMVFLLPIVPAIHLSWGLFINFVFVVSIAFNIRYFHRGMRGILPWLLAGSAISGISLLIWFSQSSGITLQSENAKQYLWATIEHWDIHRRQLELDGRKIILGNIEDLVKQEPLVDKSEAIDIRNVSANGYSLPELLNLSFRKSWPFHPVVLLSILCLVWLVILRNTEFINKRILFTALLVSGVGAAAFSGIMFFPISSTPPILWVLMPQRWFNISIICFVPLLLATLGWEKKSFRACLISVAIAGILVFKFLDFFPYYTLWFITCVIIVFGLLSAPHTTGKQIAVRNCLFGIVIFLIPVMCVCSFIFLIYYDGPFWFWGNIGFGSCIGIVALLLGYLLDDNKIAYRWFVYISILFSLSGLNLMIASLVGGYDDLTTILIFSAILLILCAAVVFWYRKWLVDRGTNLLRCAGKRIYHTGSLAIPMRLVIDRKQRTKYYCAVAFISISFLYLLIGQTKGIPWTRPDLFDDRTNNVFWEETQNREGMLLTGPGIQFVQLRTRRPVLLDTGVLNWLAYLPEAGPAVESILSQVYHIDFFDPPDTDGRNPTRLYPHWGKKTWLQRTRKEWLELKEQFNITDILVYDDWDLNLPMVTAGQGYTLYTIP